jgi:hypothetical protein
MHKITDLKGNVENSAASASVSLFRKVERWVPDGEYSAPGYRLFTQAGNLTT